MIELDTDITVPSGKTDTSSVFIPVSVSEITVTLTRTSWPTRADKNLLRVTLFVSEDEKTWEEVCSCTTDGGVMRLPTSQTAKFARALPAGIWAKAEVDAAEPVQTRVVITWQS